MTRTLLVEGAKTFQIDIPDDAKVTFGPWSPPNASAKYTGSAEAMRGTLRVYDGKGVKTENILAVFSGVVSFRDMTNISYRERVAVEQGATLWNSDKNGYLREEKVKSTQKWMDEPDLIGAPKDEDEDEDDG